MPTALRILGLDPGSLFTGYALVEKKGSRLRAIDSGRIACHRKAPLSERLGTLSAELEVVVDQTKPDAAALESVFQGLNPKSLIVLAQARGALLAVLSRRQVQVREYSPTQVKTAVSGYGRADKQQVAAMVQRILGLDAAGLSSDETDALAIAICCAQMSRTEELLRSESGRKLVR
jgi:crossover junction endodeoxyribonuclease RuvC